MGNGVFSNLSRAELKLLKQCIVASYGKNAQTANAQFHIDNNYHVLAARPLNARTFCERMKSKLVA